MSYMVGTAASFHNTTSVVISIGVTLAISVAIVAFAAQTRIDFTACYGVMTILVLDLVLFGILSSFYYSHIAEISYGCLGALLFSLVRGNERCRPVVKMGFYVWFNDGLV